MLSYLLVLLAAGLAGAGTFCWIAWLGSMRPKRANLGFLNQPSFASRVAWFSGGAYLSTRDASWLLAILVAAIGYGLPALLAPAAE